MAAFDPAAAWDAIDQVLGSGAFFPESHRHIPVLPHRIPWGLRLRHWARTASGSPCSE